MNATKRFIVDTDELQVNFEKFCIPERMRGGIARYLTDGIPTGDFLKSVIENDLRMALWTADNENLAILPNYVRFFHNACPGLSWGSRDRRSAWIKQQSEGL